LDEPAKSRVIEATLVYRATEPDSRVRYPAGGNAHKLFRPRQWSSLFVRPVGPERKLVLHWRGRVAWLYRGVPVVESDLLGPHAIRLWDELRMTQPIFSDIPIDAGKRCVEN
jgi:hypothetical protein